MAIAVGVAIECQGICRPFIDFAIAVVVFAVAALLGEVNDQLAHQQPRAGIAAGSTSAGETGVAEVADLRDSLVDKRVAIIVRTVALLGCSCADERVAVVAISKRAARTASTAIAVKVETERSVHADPLRVCAGQDHALLIHVTIAA